MELTELMFVKVVTEITPVRTQRASEFAQRWPQYCWARCWTYEDSDSEGIVGLIFHEDALGHSYIFMHSLQAWLQTGLGFMPDPSAYAAKAAQSCIMGPV